MPAASTGEVFLWTIDSRPRLPLVPPHKDSTVELVLGRPAGIVAATNGQTHWDTRNPGIQD